MKHIIYAVLALAVAAGSASAGTVGLPKPWSKLRCKMAVDTPVGRWYGERVIVRHCHDYFSTKQVVKTFDGQGVIYLKDKYPRIPFGTAKTKDLMHYDVFNG